MMTTSTMQTMRRARRTMGAAPTFWIAPAGVGMPLPGTNMPPGLMALPPAVTASTIPPGELVSAVQATSGPSTSTYVVGGLVLAGLAGGAWWLFGRKRRNPRRRRRKH
jgi:LPXTG-motif cell wall-anchored protein